jgi:hypothetical protein
LQILKEEGTVNKVTIVGTSGVAAVWGFHHYLKYYCFSHVSWDSDQLSLPEELPTVSITVTSADRSVALSYLQVPPSKYWDIALSLSHKGSLKVGRGCVFFFFQILQ